MVLSSIANRSLVGSLGYVLLLASSLYANKYVLTVLGFRYPMVFQVKNQNFFNNVFHTHKEPLLGPVRSGF